MACIPPKAAAMAIYAEPASRGTAIHAADKSTVGSAAVSMMNERDTEGTILNRGACVCVRVRACVRACVRVCVCVYSTGVKSQDIA